MRLRIAITRLECWPMTLRLRSLAPSKSAAWGRGKGRGSHLPCSAPPWRPRPGVYVDGRSHDPTLVSPVQYDLMALVVNCLRNSATCFSKHGLKCALFLSSPPRKRGLGTLEHRCWLTAFARG